MALAGHYTHKKYPFQLCRVRFRDRDSQKTLVFLTNLFDSVPTELFFKWVKQHLRIKQFYGTSENAVRAKI